jgi:hypothetical protein
MTLLVQYFSTTLKSELSRGTDPVRTKKDLTQLSHHHFCVYKNSAAANAIGIPACLITNFTFDEVYRYLREGDPLDKDVIACADAALEDYKKATLLLRLPGSIDIPSFEDEIKILEVDRTHHLHRDNFPLPTLFSATTQRNATSNGSLLFSMESNNNNNNNNNNSNSSSSSFIHPLRPLGWEDERSMNTRNSPIEEDTSMDPPSPQRVNIHIFPSSTHIPVRGRQHLTIDTAFTKPKSLTRVAIDVPMVVRKAINTREDVLRALGVDEATIRTKKMVLVSFGGQRLKQGWGNPLPDGWIGVICGLPVSHELPSGFYRSPHGVYVPDLTHAADIVIGKLVRLHVLYLNHPPPPPLFFFFFFLNPTNIYMHFILLLTCQMIRAMERAQSALRTIRR